MHNRNTAITALIDGFNSRFERFGLALTHADAVIGESRYVDNGDDGYYYGLHYRFDEDTDSVFLDYYFWEDHRTEPEHTRLRPDGHERDLPVQSPGYSYPSTATDEEKRKREQEYYAENRRISGMLCAKGFWDESPRELAPVQVAYVSRCDTAGVWRTTEEYAFYWLGNYDKALGAAMWLVDDYLERIYRHGMGVDELLASYRSNGPDPFLRYEDRALAQAANPVSAWFVIYQPLPFNAWGYAETVARRLCGLPEGESSRSLSYLVGRYDRYDRHRMESQLLLNRGVRLVRDVSEGRVTMPAGSIGQISPGSLPVDTDKYDYSREAPVMFDPPPQSLWRRIVDTISCRTVARKEVVMAVPYTAMEVVESDAEYAAKLDDIYGEIR